MRTPDGWRVDVIELTRDGRTRQFIRVCHPSGVHVGDFLDAPSALAALRDAGGEPADLLDYVGR